MVRAGEARDANATRQDWLCDSVEPSRPGVGRCPAGCTLVKFARADRCALQVSGDTGPMGRRRPTSPAADRLWLSGSRWAVRPGSGRSARAFALIAASTRRVTSRTPEANSTIWLAGSVSEPSEERCPEPPHKISPLRS